MSRIRSKNTKPELLVRKYLHAQGFRFKLHDRSLPGSPDLVLPKYNCALFVHGCFWHGHECQGIRVLQQSSKYWQEKIKRNIQRDQLDLFHLSEAGWRIALIWECALKKAPEVYLQKLAEWIPQLHREILFLP